MTTPSVTSTTDSQMHDNIMVAGLRDRPPMLATGRYPQWRPWFLRYIDIRPNGDTLRKCILNGPYIPTTVVVQAIAVTDDSLAVPEHTTVETPMNMSPENKAHFNSEKEAIHLILTRIGDEIYSTVDACQIAQEIYKGKEIAKLITPPSESAFEEDNDPKQAQKDKGMQKNLALIAKYFKRIYKPTNNLRTSINSRNKNVDTTLWYKNENQSGQFGNQRTMNVAGAREMDEEIDEQELEAHYSYMAKIQEVPTADSGTDSEPLEQVQNNTRYNVFANDLQHSEKSKSISNTCIVETNDSNVIPDSPDMCEDDIQNDQNDVESDDERVALANLKLDVDESKNIQKQLKKANTTLAHELKECKIILAETSKTLGEPNSVRDRVNHKTNVSRPQHRSNQIKDKVVPNNSQLKLKKTQVEDHPWIPSISNNNDSLNSKTLNVNAVCATCGKYLVDSDHFACVTKMLNDVNARTKKPNVMPISTRKPKGHANRSVTTPHKKKVTSKSTNQKPKRYYRMLYEKTTHDGQSKAVVQFVEKYLGLNHNFFSVGQFCDADLEVAFWKSTCFVRDLQGYDLLTGLNPQRQKALDYDNFDLVHQLQNVSPSADAHVPSQQELDLLFGPLYDEFFTAEENNDNQAEEEHLQDDEFTNPFCTSGTRSL
nr:integrase, catalytic region, zinc finger, CCHC-type, peptidase aspartic, catalytic [Tanacetum cinerariifolium]